MNEKKSKEIKDILKLVSVENGGLSSTVVSALASYVEVCGSSLAWISQL